MAITLKLVPESFIPVSEFKRIFPEGSLDEISNGVLNNQVVPKIYLSGNSLKIENFELTKKPDESFPVLNIPGYTLIILSFKDKIVFTLQQINSVAELIFDPLKCNYYPFLIISRQNTLGYEKGDYGQFYAIKPKVATKMAITAARRGIGRGLLPGLIVRGIIHAVDRNEDDLILTKGIKYTLSYLDDSIYKAIEIVAHHSTVDAIDQFLLLHWKNTEPTAINKPNSKEGCYIATCCYKSYDHPSVRILRTFRDNISFKKGKRTFIY